jgi:hypothetical protein
LVLSFDQQVNVSRDQGITGVNSGGVTFINLSSKLSADGLAPGAELPPFTITMPRGSGVPSVAGALYAKSVDLFGPVAVAQSVTTDEDAAVSLVLSGTDADGDALTFTVVTSPSRGVLTGTAPNLTYTPNPNAHGTDRFTFKVNDGRKDSSVAAVTVLVRPVNDVPVAAAQTVAVASGAARSITLAGSDVDGDALSFAVVTPPTQGVLSGTAPNLTYTSNPNATGADNFTFKVNDGRVDSPVATVAIEFGAGNRPPVAIAQTVTADEDIPKSITLAGSDADGNALTHIVVSPPNRGTLSGTAPNLIYTPNPNAHGADSFTFKVNDGTVDSPVTTVSITVRPVNDVPVAAAQTVAVASGAARSITLAGSDVDGDVLSFAVVTPPTQGVLSGTAPNLTYTANPNATGADNFTFKVNDGRVDSPVATVVIDLRAVADPPSALTWTGRVVDEDGIPLDAAEVQAIGSEEASSTPVRRGGWFSVPVETGIRGWRISAPGRHASFRARSAVMPDVPDAVVLASSNHVAAPAAFELPSPLPAGWTPLVAGRFPAGRFELGSQTNGPVSEGAAVVAWDEDRLAWRLLDSTDREAVYRGELAAAAVVARIRPDVGLAGTSGVVGTFLDGPVAGVGTGTVTATGRLEPPNRIASTNRSEVLTRGFVEFRSTAGSLPSGTAFRCEVRESYELRDGSRRVLPAYTMLIRAYRVAGADAALLRAEFPLRPTQLLSSERLAEARVEVDVLDRSDERLRPIPAGGTVLQSGLFRLGIPAGMFPAGGQARLTELQASPFDLTLPAGVAGVAAFDLDLPAGAPGGTGVSTEFLGQTPGTRRVLARVVFDADEAGFQPLLRLRAGTDGVAVSEEPAMGGLRGMDGGGRHVVFQLVVAQPQVVVRGTARNVAGVAVAGMVVRSGPWTALTDADGRYELLVPAATATASLTVTDRSTGDVAQVPVPATAEGGVATVDVDLSPRGPFLVASNPVAGATAVARVSPVVLTFSRPLNPATVVVPGAVVLAGTNGVVLPAAVSINPSGDTVTLLPTAQLPASAPLRVVLATNLQDRLGRTLEGAREITFTTLGDTLRRADAVLTIFEPVNGLAGMSGGSGLADPESAVILINQTTGETATVLSKPDGSFTNRIAATADDELAAILVNRNGTQTTVPAARQEFRDGSVGLFGGGGVIRRTFGSGEMELEVPPGAISGKTVFRIQERSVAEVTGALGSLLPTDQRLLGGFRFAIGGDPLRKAPRIRLPIPAGMKDEFGAGLTNREFLIVRRRVDEDGAFLEPVDVAKVVGDRLENRGVGVPFIPLGEAVGDTDLSSLFAIRLPAVKSRRALSSVAKGIGNVYGRGVGFEDECGLLMPIRRVRLTPIRGSVFSTVAAVRGSERRPVTRARILGDGMSSVMATSPDSRGAFSTFVETDGDTVGARATSPDFPGQSAVGVALVARGDDGDSVAGAITLMFDRGEESLIDREDPRVSVSHSPGEPTVGNAVTVRVQGNDDQRVASVELVVEQVLPLFSLQPVSVSDIRLTAGAQVRIARGSLRQSFTLDTSKPARIRLRATVRDSASKRATTVHTVVVGASSVPRTGDDLTGPSVVSSSPFPGEDSFQPGRRIRLTFSEPVTGIPDNLTAGDLFQLSPFSGVPTVEFAADRKSVELTWYELIPDRDYTLTVNPLLRDEAGNLFDQNPSNNPPPTDPPTANPAADPFQLPFRTSPQVPVTLRGVHNGAGAAVLGNRLLVLDRTQTDGTAGSLHVYDPTLPDAPLRTVGVRPYPRSLQVLRSQSYPASSQAPAGTADLVLVCGGQVNQSEPWMMIFAFKPDGSIVELLRQDVDSRRDTSRSAFKVLASPPLAASLLIGASTEVVAFDLFEAIREQRIFGRLPGSSGVVGIPLGGRHVMTEDSEGSRVRDFDIGMAGDRIALVGSPNGSTPPPAFETVIEEFGHSDPVPVDRETKRVFLALDQPVRTAQGVEAHDFAILSQFPTPTDPNGRLLVLDLDDPERPVVANSISIPIRHGTPQRIQRREDGLLSLACTEDVLLLDPTRLLSPTPADNGAHPALVGRFIGMGTLMPDFVSTSDGMVARAQGERTQVMGQPARVDLTAHFPGTVASPGPKVPENREGSHLGLLLFCNTDYDLHDPTQPIVERPTNSEPATLRDFERTNGGGAEDNELVILRLGRPPLSKTGRPPASLRLRVVPKAGGASPVQFRSREDGRVFPLQDLALRSARGTASGALFARAESGSVELLLEGVSPAVDTEIRYEVFDDEGGLIGEDVVSVTTVEAEIESFWSEQFPGSKSNLFPGNTGAKSNNYVLMANTSDDKTEVGVKVKLSPDEVEIRQRLQIKFMRAGDHQIRGLSEFRDGDYRLSADDVTAELFPSPVANPLVSREPLLIQPILLQALEVSKRLAVVPIAGFDQDGDGVFGVGERNRVMTARMLGGVVVFNDAPSHEGIYEPHIKVVPRKLALGQFLQALPLVFSSLLVGQMASVIDLPNPFTDGNFIAPLHLTAFVTGEMPLSPFAPQRVGDFTVKDTVGGGNVSFPLTQGFDHNVGPFTPSGTRVVPFFRYTSPTLSEQVLRSSALSQSMAERLKEPDVLEHIRDHITGVGVGGTFRVQMLGGRGGFLTGNFNPVLEPDLFFGIGGTQFHDFEWAITGTVVNERPFLGRTRKSIRVDTATVKGKTQDLYDWELSVNPFACLISTGFDTYGNAGKAFVVEIPFEGEVDFGSTLSGVKDLDRELDLP